MHQMFLRRRRLCLNGKFYNCGRGGSIPRGPGKYDAECTKIQEEQRAAGVLLIVLNGQRGSGFSVAATLDVIASIPEILRDTADQIENDVASPRAGPD